MLIALQHRVLLRQSGLLCIMALATAVHCAAGQEPSSPGIDSDELQCGHWALLRMCHLAGVPVDRVTVRKLLPRSKDGHSFQMLADALTRLGLPTEGRYESFRDMAGALPVIAHFKTNHFVVVTHASDATVAFFDGSEGRRSWPTEEFKTQWSNRVLRISPWPHDKVFPAPGHLTDEATPRTQFQTLLLDKGTIVPTEDPVEFVFPFYNAGTRDLVVKSVRTSCGCLSAVKPARPLRPGERDVIILKYQVSQGQGSFSYSAHVLTNDPLFPSIPLMAAGNTCSAVLVEPAVRNLGRIVDGETRTTFLTLRYQGERPLEVRGIDGHIDGMNIKYAIVYKRQLPQLLAGVRQPPASYPNMAILKLSVTPERGYAGATRGQLSVLTNIKGYERIALPVTALVVPPVTFLPGSLFLGEVSPGAEIHKDITAVSASGCPFSIVNVQTGVPSLNCTYQSNEGGRMTLSFAGHAEDADVLAKAKVTFNMAVGEERRPVTMTLPIRAWPRQ